MFNPHRGARMRASRLPETGAVSVHSGLDTTAYDGGVMGIAILAAEASSLDFESLRPVLVGAAILVLVAFALGAVFTKYYKRCPPNRLLVIYGKTSEGDEPAEVVHGGARMVLPVFQDHDWLALEPIRVTVTLPTRLTVKKLGFPLPTTFAVAIGTEPDLMRNAAVRLLNLDREELERQLDDLIADVMTRTVQASGIERGDCDEEGFYGSLRSELGERLAGLGLELISIKRE